MRYIYPSCSEIDIIQTKEPHHLVSPNSLAQEEAPALANYREHAARVRPSKARKTLRRPSSKSLSNMLDTMSTLFTMAKNVPNCAASGSRESYSWLNSFQLVAVYVMTHEPKLRKLYCLRRKSTCQHSAPHLEDDLIITHGAISLNRECATCETFVIHL